MPKGDIRKRFGARLRQLRRQTGYTQVQLADHLGLDRSYIADVERGNRNISLMNLEVIAEGFGMSLAKLLARI